MKIGVISDVHDNMRSASRVVDYLNKQKIGLLIHCGDWDMPFTMRSYLELKCPIKSVMGNGDPDFQKFKYQLQNLDVLKGLEIEFDEVFHDFEIDGKRVGVFHGNSKNFINLILESQLFDVFCVGHTHKPKVEKKGKTLVINPGSLVGYYYELGGEVPITFAIYDSNSNEAEIVEFEKIMNQK